MAESIDRRAMRRVFEETLTEMSRTHVPADGGLFEARGRTAAGGIVVIAYYKVYRDGTWQCFQVLDEVLWPVL